MNNIIAYENFSNHHIDETNESLELNAFEATCIEEGIENISWETLYENQDNLLFEAEQPQKKGGLLKFLGKIAGGISKIAGPIMKNLGIPMSGAITGVLDKVSKGIAAIKPKEGQKISQAAKDAPEMKQVSDVVKGTLDKVMKEVESKGPESLFSKATRDSILSLAAIMKTVGEATLQVEKEAKSAGVAVGTAAKTSATAKPAAGASSKAATTGAAVGKAAGAAVKGMA